MKRFSKMLTAAMILIAAWPLESSARGRHGYSSHRSGHHASHRSRGESCWRTNRHTHAHFRIC